MPTTSLGFPYPAGTDRLMDGDNVMTALAQAINDAGGVAHSGVTPIAVPAVDTNYSAAVTFPAGRFTANPVMVVAVYTGSPHQVFISATNVTPSGGTLYVNRSTGTGTQYLYWVAVQV